MLMLAEQSGPGPGPFLLIWGVFALVGGGALATKKVSARFRSFVVEGLAQKAEQQARARSVRPGLLRALGGFFAVSGMIALPLSIAMMARS
ncbi:hypothetical protein [Streptomyces sp. NBC_00370]|uniref:hypothetical protein n=1 Tax=Streptomyces sp. NBC_00370 TaxID=2975728 RepID=UPI002E255631